MIRTLVSRPLLLISARASAILRRRKNNWQISFLKEPDVFCLGILSYFVQKGQRKLKHSAFSAAFPYTIPVLMGYLSIGMAFGMMLQAVGYGPLWAVFMSLVIYAGSGQYLGCTLLAQGAALPQVALLTFLLNFRHLFYGLSLLDRFQGAGKRKPYLIFALTDETYALLTSVSPPYGVDPCDFYWAVSLLNHGYWILGSLIGSILGSILPLDTSGIDFAMTAVFVVIAV